jgi:hypothetical protein
MYAIEFPTLKVATLFYWIDHHLSLVTFDGGAQDATYIRVAESHTPCVVSVFFVIFLLLQQRGSPPIPHKDLLTIPRICFATVGSSGDEQTILT